MYWLEKWPLNTYHSYFMLNVQKRVWGVRICKPDSIKPYRIVLPGKFIPKIYAQIRVTSHNFAKLRVITRTILVKISRVNRWTKFVQSFVVSKFCSKLNKDEVTSLFNKYSKNGKIYVSGFALFVEKSKNGTLFRTVRFAI